MVSISARHARDRPPMDPQLWASDELDTSCFGQNVVSTALTNNYTHKKIILRKRLLSKNVLKCITTTHCEIF